MGSSKNIDDSSAYSERQELTAICKVAMYLFSIFVVLRFCNSVKSPTIETTLGLLITIILCGLIVFFVKTISLHTEISYEGIQFKFSPFIQNWKQIKWSEIENISVVKCTYLFKFGGWSIRSPINKTTSFILGGDMALKIKLKSGHTIMIGTTNNNKQKLMNIIKKNMGH